MPGCWVIYLEEAELSHLPRLPNGSSQPVAEGTQGKHLHFGIANWLGEKALCTQEYTLLCWDLSISKTMLRFYAKFKMSICIFPGKEAIVFIHLKRVHGPWTCKRINALHVFFLSKNPATYLISFHPYLDQMFGELCSSMTEFSHTHGLPIIILSSDLLLSSFVKFN